MELQKKLIRLDTCLFNTIYMLQSKIFADKVFPVISRSADGWLYIPALLLLSVNATSSNIINAAVVAFPIQLVIYLVIKKVIRRLRPCDRMPEIHYRMAPPDRFSFPSGHTAGAFTFTIIAAYYFPAVAALLFLWAFMVGISRIYLGVHYPTDVLAGFFLGSFSGYSGISLTKKTILCLIS